MSCADVCLDHGWDGDTSCYSSRVQRAGKNYKCDECGGAIQRGDKYERQKGKWDDGDGWWSSATCLSCYEIRKAFVCGSHEIGRLWESIREEMFPIWETHSAIDCLAKIEEKEIRDRLRREYEKWQEENQ